MGVYGLAIDTHIVGFDQFLGDLDPEYQIKGQRVFGNQIKKSALWSQKPTIWVSMDFPGPQQPVLWRFGPWGPNFGSEGLLEQN